MLIKRLWLIAVSYAVCCIDRLSRRAGRSSGNGRSFDADCVHARRRHYRSEVPGVDRRASLPALRTQLPQLRTERNWLSHQETSSGRQRHHLAVHRSPVHATRYVNLTVMYRKLTGFALRYWNDLHGLTNHLTVLHASTIMDISRTQLFLTLCVIYFLLLRGLKKLIVFHPWHVRSFIRG